MPYISQEDRNRFAPVNTAKTAGELNYLLTKTIQRYWVENKGNYQAINDIVGALEGAKAEFQRRIVVGYEERAIQQNGDLY